MSSLDIENQFFFGHNVICNATTFNEGRLGFVDKGVYYRNEMGGQEL